MKIYRAVILIVLIFLMACGKKSPCWKSTGNETSITRDLNSFTRLNVFDKIDIELRNSTQNRVTIIGGENLVEYISTDVTGNELTIENHNKCNFLRTYKRTTKVILEFTSLEYINFVGAGYVSNTDTLKQHYIEIEGEGCSGDINLLLKTDSIRITLHTGNSNLNLKGSTKTGYFYSGGTTIMHAEDLNCEQAFVNNSGSGDFFLNVTNYLFVLVAQQGSVYYSGNCSLDGHDSGKGEIIKY